MIEIHVPRYLVAGENVRSSDGMKPCLSR